MRDDVVVGHKLNAGARVRLEVIYVDQGDQAATSVRLGAWITIEEL